MNKRSILNKNSGITFIELLIAITISAAISIPVWLLYQAGLRASTTGVMRIAMISEGQRITKKISNDLKHTAIAFEGSFSISFDQLLKVTSGSEKVNKSEFSFLRFCANNNSSFSDKNTNNFYLCRIVYRLEKNDKTGFYTLLRNEYCGKREKEKVISTDVNFFQIRPIFIQPEYGKGQWFWNISLQLAQSSNQHLNKSENNYQQIIIEDFYSVISSKFFNSIWNYRFSPRNFNTVLYYCK